MRSFYLIKSQISCRGVSLQVAGAVAAGNLGSTQLSITSALVILHSYAKIIAANNNGIINRIDSLDTKLKNDLFQPDVKITGSYYNSYDLNYTMVTNFQAVEEYINAMLAVSILANPVSTAGFHMLYFIVLNTLNDFLAKSSEITHLLKESVSKEKDSFQKTIVLCLIVTPFLLAGIAVVLSLIIWSQYNKEKNNLLAFTKLSPEEVRKISVTFKNFRTSLHNEESFEEKQLLDSAEGRASLVKLLPSPAKYRKQQGPHTIKYSKIRVRYYAFFFQVIIYTTVLLAIMVWNFLSAQNVTKTIYRRQEHLDFASYISTRISIDYTTCIELFTSNNTNLIEHHLPLKGMLSGLSDIREIREEITEKFLEVDGGYDPDVQLILFDNFACSRLSSLALSYCNYFVGKNQPINLVQALASFESLMTGKLTDYYKANKASTGALISAALINIADLLPAYGLVVGEAQLIVNIVDTSLKKSITKLNDQRARILIVFSFALVAVSVLIWFKILSKLRELNNDIKKVLQVFPPNLILSSFLLKKFLKRTSPNIQFT